MQEMVVEARRDYEDLGARLAISGALAISNVESYAKFHKQLKRGKLGKKAVKARQEAIDGARLYTAMRQRFCWRRPLHPMMRPGEWMRHYDRALAAVHEVAVADDDEDTRAGRGEPTPEQLGEPLAVPTCKVQAPSTRHIVMGDATPQSW
jgi:hypothetical protein